LWLKYSKGKFGFSVQKQIWLDCGGKVGVYDYDIYRKFADKVKWRNQGNWLSYDELNFTDNAIQRTSPWLVGGFWSRGGSVE
jgi:hypothetical protein